MATAAQFDRCGTTPNEEGPRAGVGSLSWCRERTKARPVGDEGRLVGGSREKSIAVSHEMPSVVGRRPGFCPSRYKWRRA